MELRGLNMDVLYPKHFNSNFSEHAMQFDPSIAYGFFFLCFEEVLRLIFHPLNCAKSGIVYWTHTCDPHRSNVKGKKAGKTLLVGTTLTLSLSHTHTHTHTLSLSFTQTHTHTLTLILCEFQTFFQKKKKR